MRGIEHEVPDHICKFRGVQVFLNSQSHVFPRDALLWIRCTTQLVITQDEIKNIVGVEMDVRVQKEHVGEADWRNWSVK